MLPPALIVHSQHHRIVNFVDGHSLLSVLICTGKPDGECEDRSQSVPLLFCCGWTTILVVQVRSGGGDSRDCLTVFKWSPGGMVARDSWEGTCNNNYTKTANYSRLHRDQTLAFSNYPGKPFDWPAATPLGEKKKSSYVGIQTMPFKLSAIMAGTSRHDKMSCRFEATHSRVRSLFVHLALWLPSPSYSTGANYCHARNETKLKAQCKAMKQKFLFCLMI